MIPSNGKFNSTVWVIVVCDTKPLTRTKSMTTVNAIFLTVLQAQDDCPTNIVSSLSFSLQARYKQSSNDITHSLSLPNLILRHMYSNTQMLSSGKNHIRSNGNAKCYRLLHHHADDHVFVAVSLGAVRAAKSNDTMLNDY